MGGQDARALVAGVESAAPGCRDRARITAAVASAARLQAWLDHRNVELAADLASIDHAAEVALAQAARTSLRAAEQVLQRAKVAQAIAPLGEALAAGEVTGAHVDVVSTALRQLEPEQAPALVAEAEWIVDTASRSTPEELRRALAVEVRRLRAADGMRLLERQRRQCRLRTWTDHGTGMVRLAGELDPETGLRLAGRLSAAVDSLFADGVPAEAPTDPLERQDFLRAHALLALTEGRAGACTRPEVTVVIDTTTAGGPVVDWGLPVELPPEVLHEHFATGDVAAVVVRNGAILYAPGCLDLGRASRLANHHQRRALRAIYPTCAIPGCDIRHDLCKIHHVVWWEHGGPTDLDNLLPLCVRHHHAVHDRGWSVDLRADRQLTVTLPNGTQQTTGPPGRASPAARR